MGLYDVPPEHAPAWLLPATTVLLAISAICWDMVYILLTRDAIRTHIYGMPVVPLCLNVSWELVFCLLNVADGAVLEATGLFIWMLLDLGLVWATIRFAESTWTIERSARSEHDGRQYFHQRYRRFITQNMATVLTVLVVAGAATQVAVAHWWLSRPGRGLGDKTGKFWRGKEGYDTIELTFWTASVSQVLLSAWCLNMLQARRAATAGSRAIWLFRIVGSIVGLGFANGLLWWHWPEAHSYWAHPAAIALNMTSLVCDISYGRLLSRVGTCTAAGASGPPQWGETTGAKRRRHGKAAKRSTHKNII